jgi:hypothetical protein
MRHPKLFLLLTLYLSLFTCAYALPFQEPVAGNYTCFASETDMFDVNAKDIGATLELIDAQTYRFTTTSATEEGTVSSSTFENGDAAFDALWQGGSSIAMQPDSGSEPYGGGFLVDWQGGMYVLIKNNNGLWIRCQSEGADVASVFETTTSEETTQQAATEQETSSEQDSSKQGSLEDQLLPATTTAPPPPTGAGGLSGLYIDWTLHQTTASVLGSDGMPFFQVNTLPPEYMYFLADGYVYRGIYDWSYEDLDCTRVKKDGTPLCDTYVMSGNTITFGNSETFSFSRDNDDLVIDSVSWYFEQPTPEGFTLEGSFEHTSGNAGISVGSSFYTFYPDGGFESDSFAAVVYTGPETASPEAGVESTQTSVTSYSENPTSTGAYAIRGNTIEFTYANGSAVKYVFNYSTTDTGKVDSIWLDGAVYWQ